MIGMSGTFVSHIEHGRIDVKAQDIRKFLKAYCFTVDEFENYMATSEEVISDYREDLYRMILKMSEPQLFQLYSFAKSFAGL